MADLARLAEELLCPTWAAGWIASPAVEAGDPLGFKEVQDLGHGRRICEGGKVHAECCCAKNQLWWHLDRWFDVVSLRACRGV